MTYKDIFTEVSYFYRFVKKHWILQVLMMVSLISTLVVNMINPLINKLVIDEVFISKNFSYIYFIVFLYVATFIFGKVFTLSYEYFRAYIGNLISFDIRNVLLSKILKAKEKDVDKLTMGEMFVIFEKDVFLIQNYLTTEFTNVLYIILNLLFLSVIIISINIKFFLFSLLILPFVLLNNDFFGKKLSKKSEIIQENVSDFFSFISEVFGNIKNIKILAKNIYIKRIFMLKNRRMIDSIFKYSYTAWGNISLTDFFKMIDTLLLIIIGAFLIIKGDISIGTYFALTMYKQMFSENIFKLFSLKIDLATCYVSLKRTRKIFEFTPEKSGEIIADNLKGDININVSFRYGEDKTQGFEEFKLNIKNKEKIAIVGESGCGKSTLISLILKLYTPEKGGITIDGRDIQEYNTYYYRKKISVVSQENILLNTTIKDNILFGNKVDKDKFKEILKMSQINFLDNLDEGINTKIVLGGKNLSGGQKQRLSIARALIKDSDIIILDEATSALDNITEMNLYNELKKCLKDKTVITIAHRLATIQDADRIIVLKNFKIIEQGTHAELIELNGEYNNFILREKKGENNEEI